MTKEQARVFFLNSLEDDLEEVWEQEFFDQKQFFLTRAPIQKVWLSRLDKLQKKHLAYLVLTDQNEESAQPNSTNSFTVSFSNDFIEAFHQLHAHRTDFKSKVFQAQTLPPLVHSIHQWLDVEKQYAIHWNHPPSEESEIKAIRGVEPDPMILLAALKESKKLLNSSALENLKVNLNILPENVIKEVKRLTLHAKDLI
ncbi:MAG TPA: hypothetical protein VKX31_05980 [Brumimicrobium sp.]|nr:hypothetical protein [Brumimicrobium sp.]